MFLPGFVTGRLIQRFGAHPIICVGAVLTLLCVATNLSFPPVIATFMAALALLGVGWNFMFVGGTTLLATAHDPHERVRVQATNDFIVFGTVACTAFASGAVEATGGWAALNLVVVPPTVIAAGLVVWHWSGSRAPGAGGGSVGRVPARRPPARRRALADGVEPADIAEQLLQERRLGAGRRRGPRHHGHRHRIVLVHRLHVLQHALVVEAQHHDVLAQHALGPARSAAG